MIRNASCIPSQIYVYLLLNASYYGNKFKQDYMYVYLQYIHIYHFFVEHTLKI
jgi:hypothetical protein